MIVRIGGATMRTWRAHFEEVGFDGDVDVFRWDVTVGEYFQCDTIFLIEEGVRSRRRCKRDTRGHRQVGNREEPMLTNTIMRSR